MDYLNPVRAAIAALAVLLFVLSAVYVKKYYSFMPDCVPVAPEKFDAVKWKKGVLKERGAMIESLKDGGELKKITREEAVALLGEPDEKTGSAYTYYYYGFIKPCIAKNELLVIKFGIKTGKSGEVFTTD